MRAYFAYYAPKTRDYKHRVVVSIPTDGRIIQYVKNMINGTSAEWMEPTWAVATPATNEQATERHVAGVGAGGVPTREWSIDVPDKIYDNPLGKYEPTDPKAPISKWFEEIVSSFDGADPTVGWSVPMLPVEDQKDYLRDRMRAMLADALGAIVLRTATVGQKDVPKVEPIKGHKQYTRPSGEVYYARKWGAHTDVEVVRKAREIGKTVYLKSLPGTGKTAMFEAAFGDDLYTIVGTANTEERDFIGTYVPSPKGDGTFDWYDGPLVKAVKEGKVFFIDEVGLIDPKVLSVVYPLMDGRDTLTVTENPSVGTIHAKKGFSIVAATNPNAPGVRLSEALMSRLDIKAEMTTDYTLLEKVMGVNAQVCRASANLDKRVRDGDISWAPQFRELLTFNETEKAFGTEFAMSNLLADLPEQDEDEIHNAFVGALGQKYEGAIIV